MGAWEKILIISSVFWKMFYMFSIGSIISLCLFKMTFELYEYRRKIKLKRKFNLL